MPVVESSKLRQRLDQTFILEQNILGVPTFVLNTKSAEKLSKLEHSWKTRTGEPMRYKFMRTDTPFPQVEHARYFDALIGLFATRWNPDGHLWFSLSEVIRFAGLNPKNRGARNSVLEAIKRYIYCHAVWEGSWKGLSKTWGNPFIIESDIWDEQTGELKRNPRSSRKKEQLHKITFNQHVVESLKASQTRVFLTDSLKSLKPDSYAVYRYFYGFSDQSKVIRYLTDLMNVFPWTGRASRFQPWLEARLKDGLEKGFVDSYDFKEGRVEVKCKSLKEHQDSAPVIELKANESIKNKKKPKGKTKMKASKVTDEAILEEYYRRKIDGLLENNMVKAVELMLSAGLKEHAINALKDRLAN